MCRTKSIVVFSKALFFFGAAGIFECTLKFRNRESGRSKWSSADFQSSSKTPAGKTTPSKEMYAGSGTVVFFSCIGKNDRLCTSWSLPTPPKLLRPLHGSVTSIYSMALDGRLPWLLGFPIQFRVLIMPLRKNFFFCELCFSCKKPDGFFFRLCLREGIPSYFSAITDLIMYQYAHSWSYIPNIFYLKWWMQGTFVSHIVFSGEIIICVVLCPKSFQERNMRMKELIKAVSLLKFTMQ